MRQPFGRLKPGVYTNEVTSDGFDEPIIIRARCEIAATSCWWTTRGSSPASRRGVNV